jgi:hypothetical protein
MTKVIEGNLLEQIRQRPAMFVGKRSLSALSQFLNGYGFALRTHGLEYDLGLPMDLHDWVAYRLGFRESTSGYTNMILERTQHDESAALDRFFELLDEHKARKTTVVAVVQTHPREPDIYIQKQFDAERRRAKVPAEVKIVVYTEDAGFFLTHDDPEAEYRKVPCFYPSLSWLEKFFWPDHEFSNILEPAIFARLLSEQIIFDQESKKKYQRIQETGKIIN